MVVGKQVGESAKKNGEVSLNAQFYQRPLLSEQAS